MSVSIHPTAIVEDGASLGAGVRVGPYSIIGPEVVIGEGGIIENHVTITGRTEIGKNVRIHPYAVIGGEPQDNSYAGDPTSVVIGNNCRIREHVTIHRGTVRGRKRTVVGDDCFLMAGAHVAHDAILGHHVTMVNGAGIGGHVELGDYVTLAGMAAVQQRLRVGAHAFLGGLTGVTSEIIPFAMAIGHRAELGGLNIVGLKRRGFDRPTIHALRSAYREIFFGEGTLEQRVDRAAVTFDQCSPVMSIIEFIRTGGNRPLCLPRDMEV